MPELDPYERLLGRRVDRTDRHVVRSQTYNDLGRSRASRGRMRAALRGMIAMGYRVDSLGGKRVISDATRSDLRTRVDELRDDMRILIDILGGLS